MRRYPGDEMSRWLEVQVTNVQVIDVWVITCLVD